MARRLAGAVLSLLLTSPAWAATIAPDNPPKTLPEIDFTDQDGHPLRLDAFKGKVVVLDYWASWCAPCRVEFPALDRLQDRLGPQGLVVLAVSLDRGGRHAVDKFYDEVHPTHLPKYLDPLSAAARILGLRGLPTTLIIDRQGRQAAHVEGIAAWDGPEVSALLDGLLKEK
jgi:thiol-disulfide isomerase/thioredoxin